MSWFWLAILAMLLYGIMNFLLKVAAQHRFSSIAIMNIMASTVAFLAFLSVLLLQHSIESWKKELFFAAINGSFFMLGSISKISSLKYAPANVIFPMTKLSMPLIVLYSVVLLGERLNLPQTIGIALIFAVFLILSNLRSNEGKREISFKGLALVLASAFFTSISVTTGKVATMYGINKLVYIFFSYTIVAVATYFWLYARGQKRLWKNPVAVRIGMGAGFLNFVGYFTVLTAFSRGNLSLVHPIFSLSILIPILLSLVFYREKLTWKKLLALAITIVAINLLKR